MNTLSSTDAAYIAGFIDGEGCISYERATLKGVVYHRAAVIVSNTDREVLEWICLALGSGTVREMRKKPRHKQQYIVRWCTKQAELLLEQVLPYLKIKQARAKLMLDIVKLTPKNYGSVGLPEGVREKREQTYLAIRALNKRGDSSAIH